MVQGQRAQGRTGAGEESNVQTAARDCLSRGVGQVGAVAGVEESGRGSVMRISDLVWWPLLWLGERLDAAIEESRYEDARKQ